MQTVLNLYGNDVEIRYAHSLNAGYGHKKICVHIFCLGESKSFSSTTSNMPRFDEIQDIEDTEEKQKAYFDMIESDILYDIDEWVLEILEKQN